MIIIGLARIRLVARQQMNNQSFSSTSISTNLILIDHDHIDDKHDPQRDDDGVDNVCVISVVSFMKQVSHRPRLKLPVLAFVEISWKNPYLFSKYCKWYLVIVCGQGMAMRMWKYAVHADYVHIRENADADENLIHNIHI